MPPDLQSGALPIELEQLDGAVRVDLEINTLGCEETWSGDDEQEKIPEVPKGWKTCKWFICTMKKKCIVIASKGKHVWLRSIGVKVFGRLIRWRARCNTTTPPWGSTDR